MADRANQTTAALPPDFLDGLRHAADEDEGAGHSLQADYMRRAADEIERLQRFGGNAAALRRLVPMLGSTAEEVAAYLIMREIDDLVRAGVLKGKLDA